MYERMTVVCHLWPSISPWNIWDLPYGVWRGFAAAADTHIKETEEANKR